MCGLCGTFNNAEHWSAATGDVSGALPAAERYAQAAAANEVLSLFGLTLSVWTGRFTLRSRTGATVLIDHLGAVWSEAERLTGMSCDPLDPALIARMEERR